MRIAVIDDQPDIRYSVAKILKRHGHESIAFDGTEAELCETLSSQGIELLIVDVQLGVELSGIDIIRELKKTSQMPIILMTAYTTAQNMIEASKLGVQNILKKPFDEEALMELVAPYEEHAKEEASPVHERDGESFIGSYETMKEIYRRIGLAANNDLSVLVHGQTGTGKELIAGLIHQNSSRAKHPFVALNCAAIPLELFESQLFGHEKGSFTSAETQHVGYAEQVGEGTLFLDEIGELEPLAQGKLLRFLETRQFRRMGGKEDKVFSGRIVSATNIDLREKIEAKVFREDLYFRLAMLSIEVPSLKERAQDIPILVSHFIAKANESLHVEIAGISAETLETLQRRVWSGNIRELRNAVFGACLNRQKGMLKVKDFAQKESMVEDWTQQLEVALRQGLDQGIAYGEIDRALNQIWLKVAYEATPNLSKLAEALGVARLTLRKRLKEAGLYNEE
ncbi:sigma-54-dependent Fis family transcriptional regulator [Sulfurospirillum sp. T05]|uniref:DNA-binding transcriptional regulator NtrC n=1 Tax=Sulfurospirillum tamanense TaxID=2813362 RepID=A0ABS2WTI3_9BACT|nr:sigma-54-dependent Fis family transcriptional regulator [Sulfurospirillum tamanensis]